MSTDDTAIVAQVDEITALLLARVDLGVARDDQRWRERYRWFSEAIAELQDAPPTSRSMAERGCAAACAGAALGGRHRDERTALRAASRRGAAPAAGTRRCETSTMESHAHLKVEPVTLAFLRCNSCIWELTRLSSTRRHGLDRRTPRTTGAGDTTH